jgi:hypothetical protein
MYTEGLLRKLESIEKESGGIGIRISCDHDPVPNHLGFGNQSIPIYRESDHTVPRLTEEEMDEIRRSSEQNEVGSMTAVASEKVKTDEIKSIAVSPISTLSTPRTSPSTPRNFSAGSMVLHEVLSNHRELFACAGIPSEPPFVTTLRLGDETSKLMSAMVIPFPTDEVGESGISRITAYARALQSVASAMGTVATLLQTQRRYCISPHGLVHTPVKPNRGDKPYYTPSPIIMRNMFT